MLKLIGKQNIEGMEFEGIEGGFGEGKRCMLVKDIARLHNQPLSEINRRINNNRDRFKDGVDIIDCLNGSEPFRNFAEDNGFIGSNRTKNVYILSERGYSKLLKILELYKLKGDKKTLHKTKDVELYIPYKNLAEKNSFKETSQTLIIDYPSFIRDIEKMIADMFEL